MSGTSRSDTPLILGFDCSAAHCAAALLCGDRVLTERLELMARGQAERLMLMLEEMLAEAGHVWRDLDAIGVGVGPGNFTGIRIAVSAARGLALGLGVPAVGVTGCEARARLYPGQTCAIPAPRGQIYLCHADALPEQMEASEAPDAIADPSPAGLGRAIAQVAATRWQDTTAAPSPLYLRAANAAPARDQPPRMLD